MGALVGALWSQPCQDAQCDQRPDPPDFLAADPCRAYGRVLSGPLCGSSGATHRSLRPWSERRGHNVVRMRNATRDQTLLISSPGIHAEPTGGCSPVLCVDPLARRIGVYGFGRSVVVTTLSGC